MAPFNIIWENHIIHWQQDIAITIEIRQGIAFRVRVRSHQTAEEKLTINVLMLEAAFEPFLKNPVVSTGEGLSLIALRNSFQNLKPDEIEACGLTCASILSDELSFHTQQDSVADLFYFAY